MPAPVQGSLVSKRHGLVAQLRTEPQTCRLYVGFRGWGIEAWGEQEAELLADGSRRACSPEGQLEHRARTPTPCRFPRVTGRADQSFALEAAQGRVDASRVQ